MLSISDSTNAHAGQCGSYPISVCGKVGSSSQPTVLAGLILNLKLDEAAGATTFADSSGNGNVGSCSGSTCPPSGVSGVKNNAVNFPSVDPEYIEDFIMLNGAPFNFV